MSTFEQILHSPAMRIVCEVERHVDIMKSGRKVPMETIGYDEDRIRTFSLRSKETAPDYRFMPDPNLKPLRITDVCFMSPESSTIR